MEIYLAGDIALNGLYLIDNNNENRFQILEKIFGKDSFLIANLETPVAENPTEIENHQHNLVTDEDVLSEFISKVNLKVVSLANNHILDLNRSGLVFTTEILKRNGVLYNGVRTEELEIGPTVFEYKNNKVAFIAFVHKETNPIFSIDSKDCVNLYDKQEIIRVIKSIRNDVDFIILSLHWGRDYSSFPEKWQVEDARKFIDAGANVVMGHHPHTIQPFEKYKGGYIFYSLGGLTFGDFYWEKHLRALKKKTKTSFIPVFNDLNIDPHFICLREIKGNYIHERRNNIKSWSKRMMYISMLSFKHPWLKAILRFKESVLDRLSEFLFGYYRNPFKDLFKLKSYSKIKYISRDFKRS